MNIGISRDSIPFNSMSFPVNAPFISIYLIIYRTCPIAMLDCRRYIIHIISTLFHPHEDCIAFFLLLEIMFLQLKETPCPWLKSPFLLVKLRACCLLSSCPSVVSEPWTQDKNAQGPKFFFPSWLQGQINYEPQIPKNPQSHVFFFYGPPPAVPQFLADSPPRTGACEPSRVCWWWPAASSVPWFRKKELRPCIIY